MPLMVRKNLSDSGVVRSAADLRGRRIARNGASVGTFLYGIYLPLNAEGLTLADVDLVTGLDFPDMLAALSHRVDHRLGDGAIEELHHIGIIMKVEAEAGEPRTLPDGEDALGGAWVAIEELRSLPLTPFAARVAREEIAAITGLEADGSWDHGE